MARAKKGVLAARDISTLGEVGKYGTPGTKVEMYKRLIMCGELTDAEIANAIAGGQTSFVKMYRTKLAAAGLKPPPPKA